MTNNVIEFKVKGKDTLPVTGLHKWSIEIESSEKYLIEAFNTVGMMCYNNNIDKATVRRALLEMLMMLDEDEYDNCY